MKDPVGPGRISGSAKGRVNEGRVKDAIAQMEQQK
jgi:hypothetical protein